MDPALTDEQLIELLKQNDHLALETLFNRYYKALCQFCAVYTKDYIAAEEIIANLFMKLWDNRSDVSILNVKSYLFVSAKNLALNYNQKKKDPVDSIEDVEIEQHLFQDRDTPFKILSGRESYNNILKVIDTLPESQRQVLLMSHVDHIDKHEISKILGISVRTVETTLYQSIKKIRLLLKGFHSSTSGN
jgi:RNA polymerase sigma-70 factor (family 1)